jgi:hypothetical protein
LQQAQEQYIDWGCDSVKKPFSDYSNLLKIQELSLRMDVITGNVNRLSNLTYLSQIRSPFEGINSILQSHCNLCGAFAGTSAFADVLNSVNLTIPQLDAFSSIAEQIAQATQRASNFDVSRFIGETSKMLELNNSILTSTSKVWDTLRQLTDISQQVAMRVASISAPLEGFVNLLNESSVRLSILEDIKPFITSNLASALMATIPKLDTGGFEGFRDFDWNALSFDTSAGILAYDGAEYSMDEIEETAFQLSSDTVPNTDRSTKRPTLRNVIIALIFAIYTAPAQIAEATTWYKENVPGIIESLAQIMGIEYTVEDVYVFVINERGTALRDEADAKAVKIFQLPFDSRLRVLSEVPRWREVEYLKEDGEVITGWVSKVSIEYADALQ